MKKTISILQFDVLAVFGDDINLRGFFLDVKEEFDECVLIIHRDTYINLINTFLNDKKRMCEANGHFCGLEFIYTDNWTDTGKKATLTVYSDADKNEHFEEVPIIRVNSFETEIEHG